jgi:hypothetical protein
MVSYSKRQAVGDAAEWVYQIDPQGFFVRDGRGQVRRAHWTDLVELRVGAAPLKDRPWRHVTTVVQRNGSQWEIDNVGAVTAVEFEDRSPDYAPFVRALVAKLRETTPYARVKRGHTFFGYWSIVAAVGLLLALGVLAVILIPIEGGSPLAIGLAKLGLLALLIVPVCSWLAELRPRGVRVDQAPESMFPSAAKWRPPAPPAVPPPPHPVALAPPETAAAQPAQPPASPAAASAPAG